MFPLVGSASFLFHLIKCHNHYRREFKTNDIIQKTNWFYITAAQLIYKKESNALVSCRLSYSQAKNKK